MSRAHIANEWKTLHKMEHAEDPREVLQKQVGDLSAVQVFGNRVLVAVYMKPEKTAGGVFLTHATQKEDEYQGKVALVLKVGPSAFADDDRTKFYGDKVKEGDWIFAPAKYCRSLSVNGQTCRLVEDVHIDGVITNPDDIL